MLLMSLATSFAGEAELGGAAKILPAKSSGVYMVM